MAHVQLRSCDRSSKTVESRGAGAPRAGGGAKNMRVEARVEAALPGAVPVDDEDDAELQEVLRRSMEER